VAGTTTIPAKPTSLKLAPLREPASSKTIATLPPPTKLELSSDKVEETDK